MNQKIVLTINQQEKIIEFLFNKTFIRMQIQGV